LALFGAYPGNRKSRSKVESMNREWFSRILCLAITLLICAQASFGQATTAQITGRITDPSGAVIAGGKVVVISLETGIERRAESNDLGYYTVSLLPPAIYRMSVEMAGFMPISRSGITLTVNQTARIDFAMQVGQVNETVTVQSTAPLLETETPTLSTVVMGRSILDLPSNGRSPFGLAALVPGVRPVGSFGGLLTSSYSGSNRISFSGASPSVNNVMVDGVAAENFTSGGLQISLSTDATEEFRVVTRNAGAEYGRTGGGIMNIISKSGTNEYHGSAFEFLQNKSLNANDFFSNSTNRARVPFTFNQFGGTLGGRIIRNKTFFFGNWEKAIQRTFGRAFYTVPSDLQRKGDFSQTRDSSGKVIGVYDPTSTRVNPANASQRIRTPFSGNVIPQTTLSPVALAVSEYYPRANAAGDLYTGANNLQGEASSPLNKDVFGIKIDHYLSATRRIAGRYTLDNTPRGLPNYFGNIAMPSDSDSIYRRLSTVVNYTDTLRPNVVLDLRAGLNRFAIDRYPRSMGFDIVKLGLPAKLGSLLQERMFPRFDMTDVSSIGTPSGDWAAQKNYSWTWGGTATIVSGQHTVKFGAEERVYQWNSVQGAGIFLTFSSNRNFTNGPDPNAAATAGYGYASFLLGYPASGTVNRFPYPAYTAKNYSTFVQDDWKVTPRLTLNLGLRWEYESPTTDRFNNISNFDPSITTIAKGVTLRGGLVYPGQNGLSRGNREASWTNFGPRIGGAYQVLKKTVLRGGYGIFYLPSTGVFITLGQTGFSSATPYVSSTDGGLTPANSLSDPFPQGIVMPSGNSLGALTGLGTSVGGNLRSLQRGYSQQWSFSVQQQLPGDWMVELGYMGNRGVSLPASRTYMYLPEAARKLGTQLQTQVANPYASLVSVGTLSQPTVTQATLLNTYPQFTSASGLDSWADSIYHAATLRAEKRFAKGFSMMLSYTFSKLIDDNLGNGDNGFNDSGSNSVQNWDNLRAERAVSVIDQPQRLVISGSYVLPFGRTGPRMYRQIAGGWQTNAIATFASGDVISVSANAPTFGGSRPNAVGDPTLANPTIDKWLNPTAFANIPAFTFGNASRNLPRTRTDGLASLDLSLLKDVRVSDRIKLQFRAEAFNVSNTPTFGNPSSNINSTNFGTVRALRVNTTPRQVQLALKLYF
jgi:outer membrane receptor protein involved in Fe transport